LKTCQCKEGYIPDREDPLTDLITRCVPSVDPIRNNPTEAPLGALASFSDDNPALIESDIVDFEDDQDMFLTSGSVMDISALMMDQTVQTRGPNSCSQKVRCFYRYIEKI
jgi:hypothetical protein